MTTIIHLTREKATITVDRAKLERARVASGSATVSATVDRALDNCQLVERDALIRRVGRARPTTMSAICAALAAAVI